MGHFPPPGPVGRIGVFCARHFPISSALVWLREGRRASRPGSLTLGGSAVAGGARAARRGGASSGPLRPALRGRGRRLYTGREGYATVVVLSFPELVVVEVRGFEAPLTFPYVPGLLAFREIPPLVGALDEVRSEVDVVIFDAQGIAHQRGLGLASHLGLFLDVPAVGCAKSRLVGVHEEPGLKKGSVTDLVYRKKVVGKVVRTRTGVSPVYVSVGNRIDLDSAVDLVLRCCTRYRLPETTRQAHNAANRLRRGEGPDLLPG